MRIGDSELISTSLLTAISITFGLLAAETLAIPGLRFWNRATLYSRFEFSERLSSSFNLRSPLLES